MKLITWFKNYSIHFEPKIKDEMNFVPKKLPTLKFWGYHEDELPEVGQVCSPFHPRHSELLNRKTWIQSFSKRNSVAPLNNDWKYRRHFRSAQFAQVDWIMTD